MSGEGVDASENYKGIWGHRIAFEKRPVVLAVDSMKAYTTPDAPLFAEGVVQTVSQAAVLYAAARQAGILIIHTNILYSAYGCSDGGMWARESLIMKSLVPGSSLAEFCEGLEPLAGEAVVTEQYASAFFGTNVASALHADDVDTVSSRRLFNKRMRASNRSGCCTARLPDDRRSGMRRRPTPATS